MFIPGTGDALDIPVSFPDFHDHGLIEFAEDALALEYYEDWKVTAPGDLPFNKCAGFKVPLFLGGRDEVDNLEATDMDVYWSLMGQLRLATQGATPGTDIHGVEIAD